jgi:hypothetical protein
MRSNESSAAGNQNVHVRSASLLRDHVVAAGSADCKQMATNASDRSAWHEKRTFLCIDVSYAYEAVGRCTEFTRFTAVKLRIARSLTVADRNGTKSKSQRVATIEREV